MATETASRMATIISGEIIPDVSIVLVCWNNISYLESCLRSLYESNLHHRYEVVVVDNGSTDGSQELLRQKFPQVRLVQNERNVGLSRASNQGIKLTSARFALLLNNDTIVNGPSLDAMVTFLDDHPDVGAVGGELLNPDGSFQSAGTDFSSLSQEFLIASRLGPLFRPSYPSHPPAVEAIEVGWLSSACLLLRREALNGVGLLDEDYFIYGDEADLQFRLQKAGWKVCFQPGVTTVHYGGRSMDRWRRRKMVYRGKLLFFRKNYGALQTRLLRIMLACLSLAKMLIWTIALAVPSWHSRARKEITSNIEIIKLCVSLA
jgi:N-acetylglucosaminyl-diphospho-decaprenol L-rhamnosyltransferase